MVGVSLDNFQNLSEFAPLWRHRIQIPEIGGLVVPPEQVVGGSFAFPFVDSEARAQSGSYTYYPQFNNIDAIDINFQETEDYLVTKFLVRWLDLVFSGNDGTYRESNHYKRNILMTMQNSRDQDAISVRYNGTFPTRINPIDPGPDDAYYQVSCNFSVDSCTFNFEVNQGGSPEPQPTALSTGQRSSVPQLPTVNPNILLGNINPQSLLNPRNAVNTVLNQIPSTGNSVVDNLIRNAVNI